MYEYNKVCIEKNSYYSVYYGSGIYTQKQLLHYDTTLTISYLIKSSGNIKIEGKYYDIRDGDIVFINPSEIHSSNITKDTYHERISIYIHKSILRNFPVYSESFFDFFENRERGEGNVIHSDIVKIYNIGKIFEDILFLSKTYSEKNQILCICKIIELLNQIIIAATENKPVFEEKNRLNPLVSKTIKYIDEHFTDEINCSEIAQKLFISKYRLEHLFKEQIGISLWEYIIIKRLMLANELIQKKYSIENASYSAGFCNYSNFFRLYKKHYNMTPSEFKKICSK